MVTPLDGLTGISYCSIILRHIINICTTTIISYIRLNINLKPSCNSAVWKKSSITISLSCRTKSETWTLYLLFPADVLMTGLLVLDSEPSAPAYNVHGDLAYFVYQAQASVGWKTQAVADELSNHDACTLALLPKQNIFVMQTWFWNYN